VTIDMFQAATARRTRKRRAPTETPSPKRPRRSRANRFSDHEREIKSQIMIALGTQPDVLVSDNPSGVARYGRAAVPYGVGLAHRGGADLICVGPGGVYMALEVKSLTGAQREAQSAFETAVLARGGVYRLVRSVDEAMTWLEELRATARSRRG
jgi:hypothetical protein